MACDRRSCSTGRGALLRYLAVAHFGRGRGTWVEGEAPSRWAQLVEAAVGERADALRAAWSLSAAHAASTRIADELEVQLTAAARDVLVRLYPDAGEVFS